MGDNLGVEGTLKITKNLQTKTWHEDSKTRTYRWDKKRHKKRGKKKILKNLKGLEMVRSGKKGKAIRNWIKSGQGRGGGGKENPRVGNIQWETSPVDANIEGVEKSKKKPRENETTKKPPKQTQGEKTWRSKNVSSCSHRDILKTKEAGNAPKVKGLGEMSKAGESSKKKAGNSNLKVLEAQPRRGTESDSSPHPRGGVRRNCILWRSPGDIKRPWASKLEV